MENNDIEILFGQLKDRYDLLLTNTFALDSGYTIDVPVLCGESVFGKFNLYKEDEAWDVFVFSVAYSRPRKSPFCRTVEKYTHWHPQSRDQALSDVIAFMEGTHTFLL